QLGLLISAARGQREINAGPGGAPSGPAFVDCLRVELFDELLDSLPWLTVRRSAIAALASVPSRASAAARSAPTRRMPSRSSAALTGPDGHRTRVSRTSVASSSSAGVNST